jgi:hypothetical protein
MDLESITVVLVVDVAPRLIELYEVRRPTTDVREAIRGFMVERIVYREPLPAAAARTALGVAEFERFAVHGSVPAPGRALNTIVYISCIQGQAVQTVLLAQCGLVPAGVDALPDDRPLEIHVESTGDAHLVVPTAREFEVIENDVIGSISRAV